MYSRQQGTKLILNTRKHQFLKKGQIVQVLRTSEQVNEMLLTRKGMSLHRENYMLFTTEENYESLKNVSTHQMYFNRSDFDSIFSTNELANEFIPYDNKSAKIVLQKFIED